MNEIRVLWRSSNRIRLKRLLRNSPMLLRLYALVEKDCNMTDDEVIQRLYKPSEDARGYKQLKRRFKRILTKCLVHEVEAVRTKYQDAYAEGLKGIEAYKTLFVLGQRKVAIAKATKLFTEFRRLTLTDLSITVLLDLVYHYKAIEYSKVKAQKYELELEASMKLFQYEVETFRNLCEMRVVMTKSKSAPDKEFLRFAKQAESTFMNAFTEGNSSYRLAYEGYSIRILRHLLVRELDEALAMCDEAQKLLRKYPVVRPADILTHDLYRIEVYIQQGQYFNAESICTSYLSRVIHASYNWFVLKMYILMSQLRRRAYEQAMDLAKEIGVKKYYTRMPLQIQECWKVFEAYAIYGFTFYSEKDDHPPFRINKLLNEVPFYSKDKQGLNVSILIIQFLFLLKQKRYMEIEDKAASLAKYNEKYLKRGETFRQHCFLRMLLEIVKADFNKIRAQRYAAPILEKMKTEPIRLSQQSIEVEIIPYEDLWEMTLKLLE